MLAPVVSSLLNRRVLLLFSSAWHTYTAYLDVKIGHISFSSWQLSSLLSLSPSSSIPFLPNFYIFFPLKRIFWWKQKQLFRFLLANTWSIFVTFLEWNIHTSHTSTILDDIFCCTIFTFIWRCLKTDEMRRSVMIWVCCVLFFSSSITS